MGIGILTLVALVISISWMLRRSKGILIWSKITAKARCEWQEIPLSVRNEEKTEMSEHISERPRNSKAIRDNVA